MSHLFMFMETISLHITLKPSHVLLSPPDAKNRRGGTAMCRELHHLLQKDRRHVWQRDLPRLSLPHGPSPSTGRRRVNVVKIL